MIPDENNRVEWFEYIVSRSMVKFKNDIANAVKQFQNNEIILKTDKNVPHGRTEKKRGVYSLTAREYLEQVLKLDRLINSKLTELSRLRHNMESLSSPVLSPDKVRSGGVNTSMSTVDKIIGLERNINSEIDKLVDLKAEIRRKIDRVYNPDFITVLTDKYINGYTLDQIAERMNVTPKTVYRWHGAALQIFRKETGMK